MSITPFKSWAASLKLSYPLPSISGVVSFSEPRLNLFAYFLDTPKSFLSTYSIKLLSFALPGLSGVFRDCGRVVGAVEAEWVDNGGGEGKLGWEKPPGPGDAAEEVIEDVRIA